MMVSCFMVICSSFTLRESASATETACRNTGTCANTAKAGIGTASVCREMVENGVRSPYRRSPSTAQNNAVVVFRLIFSCYEIRMSGSMNINDGFLLSIGTEAKSDMQVRSSAGTYSRGSFETAVAADGTCRRTFRRRIADWTASS